MPTWLYSFSESAGGAYVFLRGWSNFVAITLPYDKSCNSSEIDATNEFRAIGKQ